MKDKCEKMKETRDEQIRYLIKVSHLQLKKIMHKTEKSTADYSLLRMMLNHYPNGATPSEIAKHYKISLPSVSQKLKNLEDDGYISRDYDKKDKRVTIISLTKQGKEIAKAEYKKNLKMVNTALGNIEKEEKNELISLLKKLNYELEKYLENEDI